MSKNNNLELAASYLTALTTLATASQLEYAPADISGVIQNEWAGLNSKQQQEIMNNYPLDKLKQLLDVKFRPASSFLASENPLPSMFRQRDSIFIDGINCDVKTIANDPALWWQPVNIVAFMEFQKAWHALSKAHAEFFPTFSFLSLNPKPNSN